MSKIPVLYSFRRCPYAMRARMALLVSQTPVKLREVILRDKPREMIDASPKATVPVLVLDDGEVIDESLNIMHWALGRNDPRNWLEAKELVTAIVAEADTDFKENLDRYKYPTRYDGADPLAHRAKGLLFLQKLDGLIASHGQILGSKPGFADYAIFPFVRQFANNDRIWFDAQSLPAVHIWLQGHLSSDIFAKAMHKYHQWKTGDEEPVFRA